MMTSQSIKFILILGGISVSNCYRILGVFPFEGRSHFHVLAPIAKALAQRGHQVDVISPFKLEQPFPNYTELDYPEVMSHVQVDYNISFAPGAEVNWVVKHTKQVCTFLGHPTVSDLMKNPRMDPPYDAVIVHFAVGVECVLAFGQKLDIPVIGVVTTMAYPFLQQYIGNPLSLAITPGVTRFYKQNFTFWERVQNVVNTHMYLSKFSFYEEIQEKLIQEYIGADSSNPSERHKNIALLFTHSHYSFYGIKPKTPALIEIGGINIQNETTKLTPSLKKLIDESMNGFIYFSFGTLTVLESLPSDFFKILFITFCKLSPIRVVMRIPNSEFVPEKLCDNVFTYKWLPQQKILEHENIKAFVTHGGGLSSQETIHYSVPVICIPMFAEQKVNCDIFALKNMGIKIDIENTRQEDYDSAFQEILSNPKYKESMREFSKLYWDRPQSPQETVNYWVEYVIRHGKDVLKSPAVDLKWWQFDLIDVYFFLFSCFIFALVFAIIAVVCIYKFILRLVDSINLVNSSKKLD